MPRIITLLLISLSTALADYTSDFAAIDAIGDLTTAPAIYEVDMTSGTAESSNTVATLSAGDHKTIFFDSVDYQGNPTRAYAWIDIPAGASAATPAPAIVLIHGGGGRAFEDWVTLWSSRGYVAISIDTEGNSTNNLEEKVKHSMGGPSRTGVYNDSSTAVGDQFMYHATAGAVLANSLLRSLPFVDSTKIGVHGVSWGGVITATAVGVDQRFAFAIPTYGSGHMWDAVGNWQNSIGDISYYQEVWDPMLRLDRANMPIMWLSWPTDAPFNIDCQANSYNQSPGTQMVTLIPGMGHGHNLTWSRADPYEFADSIVTTGASWCTQESLSIVGDQIVVEFASSRTLTGATLIYTNQTGETTTMNWPETSVDSFAETAPGSGIWRVEATLPPDANGWFINVTATSLVSGSAKGDTIYVSSRLQDVVNIQPPALQEIGLKSSDTTTTQNVSLSFTAIHNLEVSSMEFINESHAGAFSHNESYPYDLVSDAPFEVTFDNIIAGLPTGSSATATLRITWLGLDNQTTNTVDIPLEATVYTPQDVVYDLNTNWSSQTPTIADHVIIQDGAEVTLDQDAEISNLSIGLASNSGTLTLNQNYELNVTEEINVTTDSLITISNGTLNHTNPSLNFDGQINLAGGTLNLNGDTVEGAGKISISDGTLNFSAAKTFDLAEIEISGGALNFVTDGSTTQTYFGANGTSTLTIIGSTPVVTATRFNLQTGRVTSPIINFELDASGVSPIQIASFMNLPQLVMHVDGSAYTGGAGEITLLQAANFATLGNLNNYSASGFAANGLSATFTQSQADDSVKLVLTQNAYGNWADSESLSTANYNANLDPDKDGMKNLLEFLLASDPQTPEPTMQPTVPISPDNLTFSFSRNANASATTTQIFQYSSDLEEWTDVAIDESDPNVTITDGNPGMEDVEIEIAPTAPQDGKLFGRLSVQLIE